MQPLIISACLLGVRCTYRGASAPASLVEQYQALVKTAPARGYYFLPVCPEQLGGLSTPRTPVELQSNAASILAGCGCVKTKEGIDMTAAFKRGAEEVRRIAALTDSHIAILRDRSPSCGVHNVHGGFFSGALTSGRGVAAEALYSEGLRLFTAEEFLTAWRQTEGTALSLELWWYFL